MHVLLLSLNYWPDKLGNAPLLIGFAEGLVARGHRVTVVCAFPHHETGRIEAPYRGRLFQRDRHNGVEILRTYIYAGDHGTAAKMANYASFTATALAAAATVRDIDVVFTPSPPLTLGVVDHLLSVFRGVPFVYNIQDFFPEAAVRLGVLTNPRVIRGFEALERWVYAHASRLCVISEGFRQTLLAKGVPDDKVTVVENFTDTELIHPLGDAPNPFRRTCGLEGRFVVQFSGRMGYSQGLEVLLEAMPMLDDCPELFWMIVGDGQARDMIAEGISGRTNAVLLPTQSRDDLCALLNAADVGLAPLRHGMAGTSVPSKIFGILASGRPVVAGVDAGSDTDQMVRTAECGLIVPPEDPAALADALRRLYHDRAARERMGENGRRYVVAHHGRDATVEKYERMLLDVVAKGR